jgi:large conductance mechanosensitive channel
VITPLILQPALNAAHLTNLQELTAFGSVKYGMFISAIINFIIVALVLFMVVKGVNRAKRKQKAEAPTPAGPTQEELLTEIRDLLKNKP